MNFTVFMEVRNIFTCQLCIIRWLYMYTGSQEISGNWSSHHADPAALPMEWYRHATNKDMSHQCDLVSLKIVIYAKRPMVPHSKLRHGHPKVASPFMLQVVIQNGRTIKCLLRMDCTVYLILKTCQNKMEIRGHYLMSAPRVVEYLNSLLCSNTWK